MASSEASTSRVTVEELSVKSGSCTLESRLYSSQTAQSRLAVVSHPLGLLGGRQDDHVVQAIVEELVRGQWKVVTYNSRGVGASTGWPTLTFNAEADDYQAVVDHFVSKESPGEVLLAGYSAGCIPASTAKAPNGILQRHLFVAYPLILANNFALKWFRKSRFDKALDEIDTPVLSVHPLRDQFTSASAYRDWSFAQKANVKSIELDSDHFFTGGTRKLYEFIREWTVAHK